MKEYNVNTIYTRGDRSKGRGSLTYQSDYMSGYCFWDNIWVERDYKIYNYDTSCIFII